MKLRHLSLLCPLLLSLNACGASASSDRDPAATPDLSGDYLSPCTPSPQADGTTNYFNLDFSLTQATWTVDYTVHADQACATKLLTVRIEGPYTISAPSQSVPGAYEARFDFSRKAMTPHVQQLADTLNSIPGCGEGGWQVGASGSVAAGCAPFGQYPLADCSADHDLVRLTDAGIEFGARPADNNMCSPDKRPTKLSGLISAKR